MCILNDVPMTLLLNKKLYSNSPLAFTIQIESNAPCTFTLGGWTLVAFPRKRSQSSSTTMGFLPNVPCVVCLHGGRLHRQARLAWPLESVQPNSYKYTRKASLTCLMFAATPVTPLHSPVSAQKEPIQSNPFFPFLSFPPWCSVLLT
jgi:hypothetical protein